MLSNLTIPNTSLATETISSQIPLFLVSDGGAKNRTGSFGTVIGTKNDIISTNAGPAPCTKRLLSSFRPEAYGMLEGILSLNTILNQQDLDIPASKQLTIFTNNQSLVTRVNNHKVNGIIGSQYTRNDVDLEMEIINQLQHITNQGFHIEVNHVWGHQDRENHIPN